MPKNAQFAETVPLLYENVYGVSPTVSINVAPALTIKVKDAITKKPIKDATVTVNTYTIKTDETGNAIFELLPAGTYNVEVRHGSYLSKKTSVTITEAGAYQEISLIPLWSIGLGVVGGGIVLTLVVTKALKWW